MLAVFAESQTELLSVFRRLPQLLGEVGGVKGTAGRLGVERLGRKLL